MDRRSFVFGTFAMALAGQAWAPAAAAPPFAPTRFSVEVRGTGPDVILIPGLTSGRQVWARAVSAVPGYRYHLIQVAGFAGEPIRGNREGPVVAPLAAEIARYIADRRLVRPAIVGHSMGGTLAMLIASDRPALVGKLMVVDMLPQPAGLVGGSASEMNPLLANLAATPGGRRLMGSLISAFAPPDAVSRRSDPDVVARSMHELAGMDLGPKLPRIRAPMTVVYASGDPRTRAAIERSTEAAYARARGAHFVRIDDSGHMVMLDQPQRFATALQTFLRD